MRRVIVAALILMAMPTYGWAQKRDRSERLATGRTAIPRDADQPAPAGQNDRRAEPRSGTETPAPREDTSRGTETSGASRDAPSAPRMARGRWRGQLPPAAPAVSGPMQPPRSREDRRVPQIYRDDRPQYRRRHSSGNIVFVPYPAPVVVERETVIARHDTVVLPVIVEPPSFSRLVLDVHPATAQIFADGYYIGIPEHFRFQNGGAVLEPGPHRIDIVASGYEPVSFEVNLTPGQSVTFRRTLTPIPREPQPEPVAAAKPVVKQPVTFYLIPGCYLGNVPPNEANLPATCDIARAVSIQY